MTPKTAIVIGSGPNGLAAGIELARNGQRVLVVEAAETLGGGLRSTASTLPGFVHDQCATVLALLAGSPYLSSLPLADFGLRLMQTDVSVAHPLDGGSAAVIYRSLPQTIAGLGVDGPAYGRLFGPLIRHWQALMRFVLGPRPLPRQPLLALRFGLVGLLPAARLARTAFRQTPARALFGGLASHAILPLEQPASAAFGLVLGVLAHATGFPIARGGSQHAATALTAYLRAVGGHTQTNTHVADLTTLPPHDVVLADLAPRGLLGLRGARLSLAYRRQLQRYRYGPGVFKIDWALDGLIPWAAPDCRRAMTLHLGGPLDEIADSERAPWQGQHHPRPLIILTQPSVVDPTRAPPGQHTAWAYCHVPSGSTTDMTTAIEDQIERFAPTFRARILARATSTAHQMEVYNPNYVGGDINGGAQDLAQMWTRPAARLVPYSTTDPTLFVCSSSAPPGGGVHGMAGFHAARAALRTAGRPHTMSP